MIAVVVYSLWDDGERASSSLYDTAAQIIPVLILALALESQVKYRWRRWRRPYRLQTIAALVLGEGAAVLAVALGRETGGEYLVAGSQDLTDLLSWLTVLGLVFGFAAVLIATLGQEEWARWKRREGASRVVKR